MIARPHVALASLLWIGLSASAHATDDELWKLVAQSHSIVVGTLSVPISEIERAEQTGKHLYVDLTINVSEWLKGKHFGSEVELRHYTEPRSYNPTLATLRNLNGKECVVFLFKSDEEDVAGFYFAGYTPKAIQPSTPDFVAKVSNEVSSQEKIILGFNQAFRPENNPSCAKVRQLIGAMLSRGTEEKAFADLEAMGKEAAPCMIMFMDDRRKLPIQHIALRNDGGFEAFRQYAPQVVVDAITAILNQITGEILLETYNGGSERERKAAVDAWRIYLYRTHFGTEPVK